MKCSHADVNKVSRRHFWLRFFEYFGASNRLNFGTNKFSDEKIFNTSQAVNDGAIAHASGTESRNYVMKSNAARNTSLLRKPMGFSLVEVLISIIVLAIGLIGAAMMQLTAARTTEQSSMHDSAISLASQIAEEIRANRAQMNVFVGVSYSANDTVAPLATSCYSQSCTASEMARQAAHDWMQRVHDALPGGRLEICQDAVVVSTAGRFDWCGTAGGTAADPIVIKIGWSERDPGGKQVADSTPRIAMLVAP
jgi:type IV pilus assembly protein PilV